ncbi:CHRM3 [Acanthosepion pharaonis]|uniref:CHRM3 n=1 Tax=Acanthosepion pharaonis TaxID=158019 RepID=A0A812BEK5_ACAPH|nr:CHRM3 [Sepia pharaonis]
MESFFLPSEEPSTETSLLVPGRQGNLHRFTDSGVGQLASFVTDRVSSTFEKRWNYSPFEFKNETLNQLTVPYTLAETAAIATICAIMSLTTIIGNILVVVAFKVEKQLQTVSNYFLLSLAVADLAIGVVSMPFFTLYLLYGYKWPLGATLCDCWLAIDYTMSNASVANLLIISFDRYFSVTRPLTYRARRTPRRAAIMIGCAWTISILLWTPWIFSWPYIEGQRTVPANDCYIQFLKTNSYVTIVTALLAFYFPVSIMTFLYYKIWRATEKRKKRLVTLTADRQHNNSKRSTCSSDDESLATSMHQRWANSSPEISEIDSFTEHFNNHPENYQKKWMKVLKRCCLVDKEMDYKENSEKVDSMLSSVITKDVPQSDSSAPTRRLALYTTALSNSLKTNSQAIHSDNDSKFNSSIALRRSRNTEQGACRAHTVATESECVSFYNHHLDSIYVKIPNKEKLTFRLVKETKLENAEPVIENDDSEDDSNRTESRKSNSEATFRVQNQKNRKTENEVFKAKAADENDSNTSTPVMSRKTTPTLDLTSIARQTKLARWVIERMRTQQVKRKKQQGYQEKKAAKILSAILLAFIITWTPYNFFTVFQVFCEDCVNGTVYAIGYSLCYLNSTINPLCYALCNVNFRTTFLRILFCRTKRNAGYQKTILLQRHRRLHLSGSYSPSGSAKKRWTDEK